MPTLKQHANTVISAINALNKTIGSKIQPLYIEELFEECRATAMILDYNGSKTRGASNRIAGDWVQNFTLSIDPDYQLPDVDYLRVRVPAPVRINENVDGIVYAGDAKSTSNFDKAANRDEVNTFLKRGYGKDGKNIICLFEGIDLLIFGNKQLKNIRMAEVCQNPREVPGFNVNTDKYPVSQDLVMLIEEMIISRVKVGLNQVNDTIVDSTKTTDRPPLKASV